MAARLLFDGGGHQVGRDLGPLAAAIRWLLNLAGDLMMVDDCTTEAGVCKGQHEDQSHPTIKTGHAGEGAKGTALAMVRVREPGWGLLLMWMPSFSKGGVHDRRGHWVADGWLKDWDPSQRGGHRGPHLGPWLVAIRQWLSTNLQRKMIKPT